MQSIFESGTSCKFMPYGQGPAGGAEFAKQHSSAMRWVPRTDAVVLAARLRDCVDAAQGHKI